MYLLSFPKGFEFFFCFFVWFRGNLPGGGVSCTGLISVKSVDVTLVGSEALCSSKCWENFPPRGIHMLVGRDVGKHVFWVM